jgi:signal transduction histidine kinase/CHASE3 domain sensor protein
MRNFYIKLMFLVIVMVLVTVSLMTYRNLNNYIKEVNFTRHSRDVFRALEQTLSTIKDAEIGYRGFLLTRDTFYLTPYYHSINTLPRQMRTLDSLVSDNAIMIRQVDTLKSLVNRQFIIINEFFPVGIKESLPVDGSEKDLMLRGRRNMDQIRSLIDRLSEEEGKILGARSSKETDFRNVAPIALLLYTLIALAGVSLLFSKVIDALDKQRLAEVRLNENIVALKSEVGIREFTQKTLRSVLDTSLDGIMAFKAIRNQTTEKIEDFELSLSNANASELTGKTEKELMGKHLLEIFPLVKEEGVFEIYKEVVLKGKPVQFEKLFHSHPLSDEWFNITAVKLEDGFVVTFTNITNQKRQRLILEERGLLLKEAEALANMGSWKWDETNQAMVWSDGLYKILDRDPENFMPDWASFFDNVSAEDRPSVEKFISDIRNTQEGAAIEYRIKSNGAFKYLSLTSKPSSTAVSVLDILGTVIDITDRKMYETQLEQNAAELKRSNEDLEQFAYVASHDLQEPLRKIRAFGDRLINRYGSKLDEQGEDYIKRMQSASTRMQTLIEDLLSFSRVSRNTEVFQSMDMNQIIAEIKDDLDIQIKMEGAHFKIGKIPSVTGEKTQIKRLFQNLINNAIKFHKPNEAPVVEVTGMTMKPQDIRQEFAVVLPPSSYVMISVKDNGIGFDERFTEKIFNIFQRLHGRTDYEGTGIGLAICRKIVINHRGFITARSKQNVGSEFVVILPGG